MEIKISEILTWLLPDFKANKIRIEVFYMLFSILMTGVCIIMWFYGYTPKSLYFNTVLIITAFCWSITLSWGICAIQDKIKLKKQKQQFYKTLDKYEIVNKLFKTCIDNNNDMFEITKNNQYLLKMLEDRDIYSVREHYFDSIKYAVIKDYYYKWLQEYFKL